jgi:hypothetical protein
VTWAGSGSSGTLTLANSGGTTLQTLTLIGNYNTSQFEVAPDVT